MSRRTAAIAVALISAVLVAWATWIAAPAGLPIATAGSTGVVFAVLGAFVVHHRSDHRIGWVYLAIGAQMAVFQLLNVLADAGVALSDSALLIGGWFVGWGWAFGPLLGLTLGVLWLPDSRLPSARWRWVERLAWTAIVMSVLALPLTESPDQVRDAFGRVVPPALGEVAFAVWGIAAVVAVVCCVASPFVRYRRAAWREQQQLRLIALAGGTAVLLYLCGDPIVRWTPLTWEHIFAVVVLLIPLAVAVGIVRHGLLDVDRLVSRTLAYAVSTVLLAGVYAAGVLGVGSLVGGSDLLVAGSTLAVAALFQPVRRRTQAAVDRRFDRRRYDARRTVDTFGTRLRDAVDLDQVTADLHRVATETVTPSQAVVWVRP